MTKTEMKEQAEHLKRLMDNSDSDGEYKYWERKYELLCESIAAENAVVFEAVNDAYSIDQIRHPMTVGELMSILEDYDKDTIVVLSFDNGYSYGSLSEPNA